MTGTNVTASGNGGIGFQFNNGGAPNTLQYSNGTISASDASFSVAGGTTANINLANTTAIANNNTLLTTSGTTTFNAQASTLRGHLDKLGQQHGEPDTGDRLDDDRQFDDDQSDEQ